MEAELTEVHNSQLAKHNFSAHRRANSEIFEQKVSEQRSRVQSEKALNNIANQSLFVLQPDIDITDRVVAIFPWIDPKDDKIADASPRAERWQDAKDKEVVALLWRGPENAHY